MWYSIDRFEGEWAVCENEDGARLRVPCCALPTGVRAGSIVRKSGDGWVRDEALEQARRDALFALQEELFGTN